MLHFFRSNLITAVASASGVAARLDGTGFFVEAGSATCFVTNWHCLTGRDPTDEGKLLPGIPDSPTSVDIRIFCRSQEAFQFRTITLDIYRDGAPIWSEHQSRKTPGFDLAFIKLARDPDWVINPVQYRALTRDFRPAPGADCFVVGFPFGSALNHEFPIWKRASVATAFLPWSDDPRFLVDTATRSGMSGSPVFASNSAMAVPDGYNIGDEDPINVVSELARAHEAGDLTETRTFGFIGIYSGAFVDSQAQRDFQLGTVMHQRVLLELIENPQNGTNEFQPHEGLR